MKFTLTYTGELKANGDAVHKHELRMHFHSQLKELWKHKPLSEYTQWFNPGKHGTLKIDLNRQVGPFRFVPLVSPTIYLICELRIFLLKPEEVGGIITQAGDIDNRLKTLLDALRIPNNESELPKNCKPMSDEDPFFCLLEDDALITSITVETERLLIANQKPTYTHLDIQITTRPTKVIVNSGQGHSTFLGNIGLV